MSDYIVETFSKSGKTSLAIDVVFCNKDTEPEQKVEAIELVIANLVKNGQKREDVITKFRFAPYKRERKQNNSIFK